jgi:DNA-binding NarL/FixJ family response regulator
MGRDGLVESGSVSDAEDKRSIRVVLVDDHPIVRNALRGLLNLEKDIEVVGEGTDGREAAQLLAATHPDILVLDLCMPQMDGLATLQELQRTGNKVKVIILTASEDKNHFVQAMKLGCSGIVTKQTAAEQIAEIIRRVYAGEIWLDPYTTAAVMRQFNPGVEAANSGYSEAKRPRSELSQREREIVALVAQGFKNREMAEKMFISEQTVKNHLHNIFDKLGVSDRLELALHAIHSGLHTVDR